MASEVREGMAASAPSSTAASGAGPAASQYARALLFVCPESIGVRRAVQCGDELLLQCAHLLNRKWPRSVKARLHALRNRTVPDAPAAAEAPSGDLPASLLLVLRVPEPLPLPDLTAEVEREPRPAASPPVRAASTTARSPPPTAADEARPSASPGGGGGPPPPPPPPAVVRRAQASGTGVDDEALPPSATTRMYSEIVIGHVRLSEASDQENAVLLESIIIQPWARGKRLGLRLMALTEHFAAQLGYTRAFLSTHDRETFYARAGYTRSSSVSSLKANARRMDKQQLSGLLRVLGGSGGSEQGVVWMSKALAPDAPVDTFATSAAATASGRAVS